MAGTEPFRIDDYDVAPLTPERWDDFVTVLGRGGIGGCWCMYWLTETGRDFERGTVGGSKGANRAAFRGVVAEAPPGLLAYEDGEPVAWARVMPRARHPGLARSRYFKTDADTTDIWSISCFVIRRHWRGRGLTGVLIKAAVDWARTQGARAIEGYPTDTDERKHPTAVYMGLASTFRRLGFDEVQRRAPHKPMMRLAL